MVAQPVEAGSLSVRPHSEIATLQGRLQEGLGSIPAPALFLVHLEVPDAFVGAAIEIFRGGNAGFLCSQRHGVEQFPVQALLFHTPFAGLAMPRAGARCGVERVVAFVPDEIG